MNKLLFPVISALALLTGACAGSEDALHDLDFAPQDRLYDVSIRFDIDLRPDNPTRASRELEYVDAAHKVSDMRIYVFYSQTGAEGSFTYYRPQVRDRETDAVAEHDCFSITAFSKSDDEVSFSEETHTYLVNPRLPSGYYRFLAVGRDDDPDAAANPFSIAWTPGVTEWSQATMTNGSGAASVCEVFAGYNESGFGNLPTTIRIDGAGGFKTRLTLRRFVAGLFLNVINIPVSWPSDYSWTDGGEEGLTVVNRQAPCLISEVAVVSGRYDASLPLTSRSFAADYRLNADRFHDGLLVAVQAPRDNPAYDTSDGFYEKGPSIAKGAFVYPVRLKDLSFSDPTERGNVDAEGDPLPTLHDCSLYLCLYTEIGGHSYPVKMIPIKLSRSNGEDAEGFDLEDASFTDNRCFNLLGNHLYCLGRRVKEGNIDEPIDLKEVLKHPDLEITVIGAWQADVDIVI